MKFKPAALILALALLAGCVALPNYKVETGATVMLTDMSGAMSVSGFHVGDGFIVTVRHFNPALAVLRYGDKRVQAKRVWENEQLDLAIFRSDRADISHLPALKFRCNKPLRIGEEIRLVAYPGGRSLSISWGRVGSINQDADGQVGADITAPLGTSGGPILDNRGYVVAMAQSILTRNYRVGRRGMLLAVPLGVAYLIPSETLCEALAEQLPEDSFVR